MKVSTEVNRLYRSLDRKQREAFADDLEGYLVACWLSRGPIPERSKVWEEKAVLLQNRLLIQLRRVSDEFPVVRGRFPAGPPRR